MTAPTTTLLREWKRLSAEESTAITLRDWSTLNRLLDENGKDLDSRAFAALIREEQDAGTDTLSFALGGPDGHGDALRAKSFRKLRFGSFTWPHQMARIMLAEQIYRAITILSGHPYHRD